MRFRSSPSSMHPTSKCTRSGSRLGEHSWATVLSVSRMKPLISRSCTLFARNLSLPGILAASGGGRNAASSGGASPGSGASLLFLLASFRTLLCFFWPPLFNLKPCGAIQGSNLGIGVFSAGNSARFLSPRAMTRSLRCGFASPPLSTGSLGPGPIFSRREAANSLAGYLGSTGVNMSLNFLLGLEPLLPFRAFWVPMTNGAGACCPLTRKNQRT
mmetsp:Transcript_10807/g.25883  ORF Transcript_10807/g.25883 Transcript_10807/m.25883 type:complete len:215 (+) Transcript_10807:183-827(+)